MEAGLAPILPSNGPQLLARAVSLELKLGQLLNALVLERVAVDKTTLLIQGAKVAVETGIALQAGEQLRLRVERLTPVVHLKIIPAQTSPTPLRNTALLSALPRQLPLAAVMNNLLGGLFLPDHTTPAALRTSAHALLTNLPRVQDVTQATTIRETLLRSGTFLESRLAHTNLSSDPSPGWVNTDLKVLLLKLRASLPVALHGSNQTRGANTNPATDSRQPSATTSTVPSGQQGPLSSAPLTGKSTPAIPTPPAARSPEASLPSERILALIQQTEGALARIQLNQLNSLPTQEHAQARWHIEIPVLNDNQFHSLSLDIEHDAKRKSKHAEDSWTAMLSVDLGDLGWLRAKLQLQQGRLNATLWAEQVYTADLAAVHLDSLGNALCAAGVQLDGIHCHHGRPAEPSESRSQPPLIEISV